MSHALAQNRNQNRRLPTPLFEARILRPRDRMSKRLWSIQSVNRDRSLSNARSVLPAKVVTCGSSTPILGTLSKFRVRCVLCTRIVLDCTSVAEPQEDRINGPNPAGRLKIVRWRSRSSPVQRKSRPMCEVRQGDIPLLTGIGNKTRDKPREEAAQRECEYCLSCPFTDSAINIEFCQSMGGGP